MRVSVENTGVIGRRMTVAVPAEQVEAQVSERLQRLVKSARLPGFRPGKVPLKVIEARYGGQVMHEVAGSLIESSLFDALGQEGLQPAAGPDVEPRTIGRGQDLEYVAVFDVYPNIEKLDLTGQEIDYPECEINDADVDATIESMRKQRVTWSPVEKEAQSGDRLVIDFEGRIDGESFPGGEAQGYEVILGAGNLLPEFEAGLSGAHPGDQRTVSVRFPADYQGADVAGKQAEFTITVKEVGESQLPDVNDDFAQSFGIQEGGIDRLREDVRQNLKREVDDRVRTRVRDQVLKALISTNDLELPGKLVENEIDRMIENNRAALSQQEGALSKRMDDLDRSVFQDEARQRVTLGLILREIVKQRDIKPDKDRIRARVESMAAGYEDQQAFVQWYYSDRQRLEQLESLVLEEQVIEELVKSATMNKKSVTLSELTLRGDAVAESV
ncbi:MAG: trigger factor [Gammaproteobacteria bacterium]|nr:trigger factor [Gammaproteobacteria bacterium]